MTFEFPTLLYNSLRVNTTEDFLQGLFTLFVPTMVKERILKNLRRLLISYHRKVF